MRVLALATGLVLVAVSASALPLLSPAPATGDGDWPFYGHDLDNTRDGSGSGIGAHNAARLAPLWSTDLGGDITGTPAVVGDTVYAATWNGAIAAVDAHTGALLWTHEHLVSISSSLAVADGRVHFTDLAGFVGALDAATGALLWTTDVGAGQENVQLYGSPVPVAGSVVLGVSSLQESDLQVSGFQGAVTRLDAASGDVIWRTRMVCETCNGGAVWSTPAVDEAHGLVFVGTGNAYTAPADDTTDAIVALSLETGDVVWTAQMLKDDVWTATTGGPGPDFDFGASPNLFELDGRLVVGEGQKSGQYHVVDALTGEPVWTAKLAAGSALGGFLGSTAYADGRLFAGLVNVGNGQPQGAEPTDVQALPTGGKVLAFSAHDGAVAWFLPKAPTLSAAAYSEGALFQGDLTGTLWAFDAQTGAPLWAFPTGEPINSGPALARGMLVVGTGSGMGIPSGHHLMAFAPWG